MIFKAEFVSSFLRRSGGYQSHQQDFRHTLQMINMYDVGLMPSFRAAFKKMAGNPYVETTKKGRKIARIAGESLNKPWKLGSQKILFYFNELFCICSLPANQYVVLNIILLFVSVYGFVFSSHLPLFSSIGVSTQ